MIILIVLELVVLVVVVVVVVVVAAVVAAVVVVVIVVVVVAVVVALVILLLHLPLLQNLRGDDRKLGEDLSWWWLHLKDPWTPRLASWSRCSASLPLLPDSQQWSRLCP
jgi:hypothetical protein